MDLISRHLPKNLFTQDVKFLQKVVIFHPKKKGLFLTMKRPASARSRPSCWDLPGGNVSYGERHDVALRREVIEETQLEIENAEPTLVLSNYDEHNKIYYLYVGYKANALNDDVHLSEEHSEYKWVSQSDFLELQSADFLQDHVMKVFEQNKG